MLSLRLNCKWNERERYPSPLCGEIERGVPHPAAIDVGKLVTLSGSLSTRRTPAFEGLLVADAEGGT